MKKFATLTFVVLIVITMTLALTACGDNDAPEPATDPTNEAVPESTPEQEEIEEVKESLRIRGELNENTYTSGYLGLSILLPDDWDIYFVIETRTAWEEAVGIDGIPQEIADMIMDGEIPGEYWEYRGFFPELSAARYIDTLDSSSFSVTFLRLDSLNTPLDEFVRSEAERTNYNVSDEKIELGNFQWYESILFDESEGVRSGRRLFAQDDDNGLFIMIGTSVYLGETVANVRSAQKENDDILAWFTPYP